MATSLTRRRLLQGRLDAHPAVRPPWAVAGFHERCNRCLDCLPACPEGILQRGDGGFPTVDFRRGECTFCGDCVRACTPGALRRAAADTPPWALLAQVGDGCLEASGVHCHACIDPCPHAAIGFAPAARPGALPRVDALRCSGCGACVAACPGAAIRIAAPAREVAA
ncbi:MAG TPA: ferredoxin-type protein NapF [Gammaproteobacteria bacterium]